jgi:hypothetical protein
MRYIDRISYIDCHGVILDSDLDFGDVTHEWIRGRSQCGLLIGRIFYPCGRRLTQDTRRFVLVKPPLNDYRS